MSNHIKKLKYLFNILKRLKMEDTDSLRSVELKKQKKRQQWHNWYSKNKDKKKQYDKKWRKANPERVKISKKKWWKK